MNRQQLVDAVGERLGDRTTAAAAVDAVLSTVRTTLADGEKVSIFGFGVFEKVDRAARTARNPATGAAVQVPATSVPRFRPGQALKDAVNGGAARTDRPAPARAKDAPAADARSAATPTPTAAPATSDGKRKGTSEGKGKKADDRSGGKKTAVKKTAGKKADGKKADGKKADGKKADGKKGKGR